MTGIAILLLFALTGAVVTAVCIRRLLDERRARLVLARADGQVDDVEFSKSGQVSGSRASVSFVDGAGRTRRFTTPWAEAPYSVGDSVVVGYPASGGGTPRILATAAVVWWAVSAFVAAAFTAAALYVVLRTWLTPR